MSNVASPGQGIRPWRHIFLGVVLCLIASSLVLLVWRGDYRYDRYSGLVVPLMLLFNHIASQYTKTGWKRKVMKAVAWAWMAFALVYIIVIWMAM
jgi:hypothetical protein